MNTVFLTDAELEKTRQGMTSFLRNFSDDEADTVYAIRSVPTRLSEARPDQDPPASTT